MFDIVFGHKMVLQIGAHLGMDKELRILALHLFAQHLVVRRVVAKRLGGVLRFPALEGKEVLHRELKVSCTILSSASVSMRSHRLLQRGHRI